MLHKGLKMKSQLFQKLYIIVRSVRASIIMCIKCGQQIPINTNKAQENAMKMALA